MLNKYLKLIPYLFQLIFLTSVFGGVGYVTAKYMLKISNENSVLLIFKLFEFIGVVIFAYMNKRVTFVLLNYLKPTKKQLFLFLQFFLLSSVALLSIIIISKRLDLIRLKDIFEINYFKIISYFFLALIVAICEEIMFRGYVALYINSKFNTNTAIFISSFLFALVHVQYEGVFPFITALLAGLVLALLTFKNHSLYPAIAFHLGWNFSYLLFNDCFLINAEVKFWGELFEVPQIILLSFILVYLVSIRRYNNVNYNPC